MLTKNLPAAQALWKIPFRIGLDTIAAWKGLLSGSSVTFVAIAKAHLHYWHWFGYEKHKRKSRNKRHKQIHGLYHGLVIWDYFVRGKTKFSGIVSNKK
jgi:hypothetical protein